MQWKIYTPVCGKGADITLTTIKRIWNGIVGYRMTVPSPIIIIWNLFY